MKLLAGENQRSDFSLDISLRFPAQIVEMILVYFPYEQEVDDSRVFAFGVVPYEIGALEIAQSTDNPLDDLIQSHDLAHHGFELREKGVIRIGRIIDIATVFV